MDSFLVTNGDNNPYFTEIDAQNRLNINSFFSQRTEVLLFKLLEKLSVATSAFNRQTIIVQNSGMQRYLELKIAEHFGICSHIDIIYPANFIWQAKTKIDTLATSVKNELAIAKTDYTKRYLLYKIVSLLAEHETKEHHDFIKHLIASYPTQKTQYALATTLADLLLKYLNERPELIDLWEKNRVSDKNNLAEKWQKELYLALNLSKQTRLVLQKEFYNKINQLAIKNNDNKANYTNQIAIKPNAKSSSKSSTKSNSKLSVKSKNQALQQSFDFATNITPETTKQLTQFDDNITEIHIFGFHFLPKTQLQDFIALSQLYKLNFYVINPCIEYWTDLKTTSSQIKKQILTNSLDDKSAVPDSKYNNLLLANYGQSGRYLLETLLDFEYENLDITFDLNQTVAENYLQFLQHSIRNATSENTIDYVPINNENSSSEKSTENQDNSLVIIEASNARREVEILRDNLLHMLETYPDLLASDILVMLPNIADYAQHIKAVFGKYGDNNYVAYSIANQSAAEQDAICQKFLVTLNLVAEKFNDEAFFKFITQPNIIDYFDLTQNDIATFINWISKNRFSWGYDSHFKSRFTNNTVVSQQGSLIKLVDNLIASYLVAANENDSLFKSGQYQTLEKLINILIELDKIQNLAFAKLSIADWKDKLIMIANLFEINANELSNVHKLLFKWEDELGLLLGSEIENNIAPKLYDFDFIVADMQDLFSHEVLRGPFLSGGISFCSLMPMRAIPAKVIGILGLNEDFPNVENLANFDLTKDNPQLSDRNHSKEARFMFLEAILSARQTLYLSYMAINDVTGEKMASSIVIQNLLSFLKEKIINFKLEEIVKRHYLQSFNLAYFADNLDSRSFVDLYEEKPKLKSELKSKLAPELGLDNTNITNKANKSEQVDFITINGIVAVLVNPLLEYARLQQNLRSDNRMHQFNKTDFIIPNNRLESWQFGDILLKTDLAINNKYNKNSAANAEAITNADIDINKKQLAYFKLKQRNMLPPQPIADCLLTKQFADLDIFLNKLKSDTPIELNISEAIVLSDIFSDYAPPKITIFVQFTDFDSNGLRITNNHKLKTNDYILGWISHLLFNYLYFTKTELFVNAQFISRQTKVITKDNSIVFNEITDLPTCKIHLNDIIVNYYTLLNQPFAYQLLLKSNKLSYQENNILDDEKSYDNKFIAENFMKLINQQFADKDITDNAATLKQLDELTKIINVLQQNITPLQELKN